MSCAESSEAGTGARTGPRDVRRLGWDVSIRKVYNVYRSLGLQLRNKTPKRRVKAKLREDRAEAVGPNDVWAMDFVHDLLALGKKLRILTIVDTHSRYCPATDVRFQYRGEDHDQDHGNCDMAPVEFLEDQGQHRAEGNE